MSNDIPGEWTKWQGVESITIATNDGRIFTAKRVQGQFRIRVIYKEEHQNKVTRIPGGSVHHLSLEMHASLFRDDDETMLHIEGTG